MSRSDRRLAWEPIALGVVAELAVVAGGLHLPLPEATGPRTFLAVAMLNVGVLGGAVTGVLQGGTWRSNVLHGLTTGAIGGAAFAVALFGTVTGAVPSPRHTGFWTIHYLVATEVPIPSWLVVRYGRVVVAAIALLPAVFVLVESGVAAGAVASTRDFRPTDG